MWPKNIGGIVVVDAAAPGQVGITLPKDVPICILDHHATCDWVLGENDLLLQWDVRATTQIVDEYLLNYTPASRTPVVRKMLLAGLLTDTARFRHADKGAFQTAVNLLQEDDIDYASFLESVETDSTSPSERGSLLRGNEPNLLIQAHGTLFIPILEPLKKTCQSFNQYRSRNFTG